MTEWPDVVYQVILSSAGVPSEPCKLELVFYQLRNWADLHKGFPEQALMSIVYNSLLNIYSFNLSYQVFYFLLDLFKVLNHKSPLTILKISVPILWRKPECPLQKK
jgi:hypothetical protein